MSSDLGSVHLTGSEAEALCLLVQKAGAVVTKEMFCTHLYKGMADEPGTKIVDVYVCKLRKKLLPICDGRDIIETVWGRGFRYVAAGIEPKFTDARVRAAG
jgi:two-component system cell cycle response regulator CtrA